MSALFVAVRPGLGAASFAEDNRRTRLRHRGDVLIAQHRRCTPEVEHFV